MDEELQKFSEGKSKEFVENNFGFVQMVLPAKMKAEKVEMIAKTIEAAFLSGFAVGFSEGKGAASE